MDTKNGCFHHTFYIQEREKKTKVYYKWVRKNSSTFPTTNIRNSIEKFEVDAVFTAKFSMPMPHYF